jgi:alkylation response protein AidB-like acyl-CoA dehydrogenase
MTTATSVPTERNTVLDRIAAGAAERERASIDPRAEVALLSASGLTALTLDREFGGGGASVVELLDFVIDLARADPIVAHILRAHYWFVEQVRRLPAGETKDRWAGEIAAGKIFGNATSERGGVAGAQRFDTRLIESGDGWLLTGAKFYSTGTAFSDVVVVSASLGDDEHPRLAKIALPVDRAGVAIVDDWDGIGQHRTGTGSTVLTDVRVRTADVFEIVDLDPNAPAAVAKDGPFLQLYLQALITGILLATSADAADLLRSRTRTFEHAPADVPRHDPVLLQTLGEIDALAHVGRAAVLSAARDIENAFDRARHGTTDPELFATAALSAARVKVHLDTAALHAATGLFDLGGASAASRARNLDRHWRNIRTITLHNPTSYKAIAIGDRIANDTPLPANGYF